jgi:alkylhydroperoxidase/carboxymuconolactone decarboxylase family protein YurZ
MHMMDWNAYRGQVIAGVGEMGKLSPETVKGYAGLRGAGTKTGHLDAKTRELIALAVEFDGLRAEHSIPQGCSVLN